MRLLDGLDAHLAEADMADLSFSHEFGKGADRVLDGSFGIDAVLVVGVDMLGAETS